MSVLKFNTNPTFPVASASGEAVNKQVLDNLVVANIAALKALTVTQIPNNVTCRGYYTDGDGGGGAFYYDAASSATDNGGSVIAPTTGSGRWIRVITNNIYNIKGFGAKGDDSTDDTAVFAAVATLGSALGKIKIFIPEGIYRIDSVTFTCNVSITGEKGSVIKRMGSTGTGALRFTGVGTDVYLSDFTFDGNSVKKTGITGAGINQFHAERVTVKYCGIPGYGAGNTTPCDGMSLVKVNKAFIKKCEFYNCERDGVLGWPVYDFTAEDCYVEGCGRGGLVCDRCDPITNPSDGGPRRAVFLNNRVYNCGAIGVYTEGKDSSTVCNTVMTGNLIEDCGGDDWTYAYGIVSGNHTRATIHDNTVINFGVGETGIPVNGGGWAIVLGDADGDSSVHNNTVIGSRLGDIWINNTVTNASVKYSIRGNFLRNSLGQGIFTYLAPQTVIADNQIWTAGAEAIYVWFGSRTVISGNIIRDCSNAFTGGSAKSAVLLNASFSAVITGGEINGANHKYAIELTNSSTINALSGVNISTFATGWISDYGGTTGGRIENSKKFYHGTGSAPTGSTWTAGDRVFRIAGNTGNSGWIYGSDSAWHWDGPTRIDEGLTVGTQTYDSTYTLSVNVDTTHGANAFVVSRPLATVNNTIRFLLGSTKTIGSGGIIDFLSDESGVLTRRIYLSGHNTGLTFYNPSDSPIIHLDNSASKFVGIGNASPVYKLDSNTGDWRIINGGIRFGGTQGSADATCGIFSGTGSPEGSVTAGIGSVYLRRDGGTNTSHYLKESGSGNTGWVAKFDALVTGATGLIGGNWVSDGTNPVWKQANNIFTRMDDFCDLATATPLGETAYTGVTSNSGVITAGTGEAAHPGVKVFSTSTSSTATSGVRRSTVSTLFGGGQMYCRAAIKVSALSDVTDTYTVRFGWFDSFGGVTDGVWMEYTDGVNSGNWIGKTSAGASASTRNGTIGMTTGWTILEILVNAAGTSATFYVNGVAIGAALTTNIPTSASNETGFSVGIIKSLGSTARSLSVDYTVETFASTSGR